MGRGEFPYLADEEAPDMVHMRACASEQLLQSEQGAHTAQTTESPSRKERPESAQRQKNPEIYLLEGASRGNLVESNDLIFQTKPQSPPQHPTASKNPCCLSPPRISKLVRWATAALCSQQALRERRTQGILHEMKIQSLRKLRPGVRELAKDDVRLTGYLLWRPLAAHRQ